MRSESDLDKSGPGDHATNELAEAEAAPFAAQPAKQPQAVRDRSSLRLELLAQVEAAAVCRPHEEILVGASARRRTQCRDEADAVVGVVDRVQASDEVADLLAAVQPCSAVHAIRDSEILERFCVGLDVGA